MSSFDAYTAYRSLERLLFGGFGPDYYRWHDLPMPESEPIDTNPGNRIRTISTTTYPIGPDGKPDFANPRYEYGDSERDALELRLTSALSRLLEQRKISG